MSQAGPLTVLCIATYEKGQEFIKECKRQGCRVLLLTDDKLRDADWPREAIDETFYIPRDIGRERPAEGRQPRRAARTASTASSPSTTSTSRRPRCCASTCGCRAWARPPPATSATSSPSG